MKLPIYQVDAFTSELFGGNPAAIIPLDAWLDDELLQAVAMENNLSETAYLVRAGDDFELRWFTPTTEVDLCGHATLAGAHTLFEHLGYSGDTVRFQTRSGPLSVTRDAMGLTLDFPAYELGPAAVDIAVCDALGGTASEVMQVEGASKQLFVFEFEEDITQLTPDFAALRVATEQCVIATAPGNECDFVSRFFGPAVGIDEDPVTGSAHCALVPYWSRRTGKTTLTARQVSARGGELDCEIREGRVFMRGRGVTFMQGELTLP